MVETLKDRLLGIEETLGMVYDAEGKLSDHKMILTAASREEETTSSDSSSDETDEDDESEEEEDEKEGPKKDEDSDGDTDRDGSADNRNPDSSQDTLEDGEISESSGESLPGQSDQDCSGKNEKHQKRPSIFFPEDLMSEVEAEEEAEAARKNFSRNFCLADRDVGASDVSYVGDLLVDGRGRMSRVLDDSILQVAKKNLKAHEATPYAMNRPVPPRPKPRLSVRRSFEY